MKAGGVGNFFLNAALRKQPFAKERNRSDNTGVSFRDAFPSQTRKKYGHGALAVCRNGLNPFHLRCTREMRWWEALGKLRLEFCKQRTL